MQVNANRFTGRVALVTGCGTKTGIGHATARLLFASGARVAITSTAERIHRPQETIDPSGHRVQACLADLTDRPQVENLIERVVAYFGRTDILVNSAGTVNNIAPDWISTGSSPEQEKIAAINTPRQACRHPR